MDYGLLPPEINSGRMYTGPGSGSLLAAATGWGELAAELHATAAELQSVISSLTCGPWLGPASASLVAATSPYVAWLQSSATGSELAAGQAAAAATAYETAFAMTVPPPAIAANRALLATLVATNWLGQNTPAIAATEAEYFEMWAQDASAMYAYLTSSLAAAQLTDFDEPPEVADSSGLARQAAAVSAADNPVDTAVKQALARLDTLHDPFAELTSSFTGAKIDQYLTKYTALDDLVSVYSKYLVPYISSAAAMIQSTQSFGQVSNGITAMTSFAKGLAPAAKALEGAAQAAGSSAPNAAAHAAAAAGGLGKALPLGALSVPPSWAPVSAVTNPAVGALTGTVVPAAAEGAMPMVPPFGQVVGKGYGRLVPTYGFKPSVMARPPSAG
ncbi:PPE family protein [Mycobacterium conspicuum]|uniref:PPE family protein n=1 Tax=Mycobacterium conspicuum TaxID=44010 RepID=A0A7I7YFW7_9MYCO|nr:PPE family protein [Mycobacterium conspicuum]BBZ39883.1 PPE family protein [Mycobacterium conspicuum]